MAMSEASTSARDDSHETGRVLHRSTFVRASAVVVLGFAALACGSRGVGTTGTGTTAGTSRGATTTSPMTSQATGTTSPQATTTTVPPATTMSATVFFVRDDKVGAARRSVDARSPARGALDALLAGPGPADAAAGLTTAVPPRTAVRAVTVSGGTATVDLSATFRSAGDLQSMRLRVAQVVYTLTQFADVNDVRFKIDGKTVTSLDGGAISLGSPQARSDWESVTPAILVEAPLPGDRVATPFHVRGTADTYEATYMVSLTDSSGTTLYEQSGMATSGSGTRGTFDQTVTFSGAVGGRAVLKLWEVSAKDGTAINVVTIPVEL